MTYRLRGMVYDPRTVRGLGPVTEGLIKQTSLIWVRRFEYAQLDQIRELP